jgi:hypothetical protein
MFQFDIMSLLGDKNLGVCDRHARCPIIRTEIPAGEFAIDSNFPATMMARLA